MLWSVCWIGPARIQPVTILWDEKKQQKWVNMTPVWELLSSRSGFLPHHIYNHSLPSAGGSYPFVKLSRHFPKHDHQPFEIQSLSNCSPTSSFPWVNQCRMIAVWGLITGLYWLTAYFPLELLPVPPSPCCSLGWISVCKFLGTGTCPMLCFLYSTMYMAGAI